MLFLLGLTPYYLMPLEFNPGLVRELDRVIFSQPFVHRTITVKYESEDSLLVKIGAKSYHCQARETSYKQTRVEPILNAYGSILRLEGTVELSLVECKDLILCREVQFGSPLLVIKNHRIADKIWARCSCI